MCSLPSLLCICLTATLTQTSIKPYLGHVRNSVPIAPTDGELPPSYPCQDLFWSVTGTICKGSAAGERGESPGFTDPGRRRGTAVPTEHTGDRGHSPSHCLTLPASCTAGPPGSRCHSPRRSPGVSAPEHNKQMEKSVCFLSLSSFQKRGLTWVQSICKAPRAGQNSKVWD